MNKQTQLFEIQHNGRTLTVSRRGNRHWTTYIGAINGDVCAIAPAKGDLLRRLIEMARRYPKDPTITTRRRRTAVAGQRKSR